MTASSQPRARLGFFNRDDRLTFIGSAIQAGVMWKFQLVTLRTHGQTRGGQFLVCPPLIPARSCVPTFRICHRGSSCVARVASPGSMTLAYATGVRCRGSPAGRYRGQPLPASSSRRFCNSLKTRNGFPSRSSGHPQGRRFRSCPQAGQSPWQSSRQRGWSGIPKMTCSRSMGTRSTWSPV